MDHKPLIAILGQNQDLKEVLNPRRLNFKLQSFAYRFTLMYISGKDHVVPDAISRRNDSPIFDMEKLPRLPPVANNVLPQYENTFGPPSWVSPPKVAAVDTDYDQIYFLNSQATLGAIADLAPNAGQPLLTWEALE